jgi:hypothetical protein
MADPLKKTYNQTTSKLRKLWDIALQLIGEYEDFDSRLNQLENKVDDLYVQINSIINGL